MSTKSPTRHRPITMTSSAVPLADGVAPDLERQHEQDSLGCAVSPAPGVGETVTGDGNEPPRIAVRAQRNLQHAIGRAVANLAIGQRWPEPIMATSSRPDDKLPDAAIGVR